MHAATQNSYTASAPFDIVAAHYDAVFTNSAVGLEQRRSVWMELDRLFKPGERVLEINCGTGTDALHLVGRGISVLACDSSREMVATARKKVSASRYRTPVDFRHLAIEQLSELNPEGLFDGILSNFGGLNCVCDLRPVAANLARLTRPGAPAIFCLFGKCCLWEVAWQSSRLNFSKAFRRFRRTYVCANSGLGLTIPVWYPDIRTLQKIFAPYFTLKSWKGVGIFVPPSYLNFLVSSFPRLLRVAGKIDLWMGRCIGLRALADHVVLIFERTAI